MQILKLFTIFLISYLLLASCSYKKVEYVIYNNHNFKQIDLFLKNTPKDFHNLASYNSLFTLDSFLLELDFNTAKLNYSKNKNAITFFKDIFSSKERYTSKSVLVISVFYDSRNNKYYEKAHEDTKKVLEHIKQNTNFKNIYVNSYGYLDSDRYYISIDAIFN